MALVHWDYFISLVDDLEHTGRYVEFVPQNFGTFSVEYSRIILAAGSEIDVVAKMLYPGSVAAPARPTIADHQRIISSEFPLFWSTEVEVPRHGFKFLPWQDWSTGKNPDWWGWYNEIKHHRDKHFAKANLECALKIVAGLAVMVWYLYVEQLTASVVQPNSQFLTLARKYYFSTRMAGQCLFCPPDYHPPQQAGRTTTPLRKK